MSYIVESERFDLKQMNATELTMGDPAIILTTVNLRRLSSINRLSKDFYGREVRIPRGKIKNYFRKIISRWQKSRKNGDNDIGILFHAESNMRKLHFRLISIALVKYGNVVYLRKTNRDDGSDPLNMIFSISGSVMREFASKYYDLPKADLVFGHIGYPHPIYQCVKVSHPTNPSLDFIDMIRAHVWELGRHLFMYRIFEYRKIKQYVLMLLHEFKPYLNWVYSGGRQGKRGSQASYSVLDLDKSLRQVIEKLRQDLGIFSTPQRVTRYVDNWYDSVNKTIKSMKKEFSTINEDNPVLYHLNDDFFSHVFDKFTGVSRRKGTIIHDQLLYGYPQPFSQKSVIYYGDHLVLNDGPYLIVAELPIKSSNFSGKADIVYFKKVEYRDKKIYRPIMVLDIKTKHSGEWDYYGKSVRNRERVIKPEAKIRLIETNNRMWQGMLTDALSDAIDQLNKYANLLRNDYINITGDISIGEIIRGVIPVRGHVDTNILREELKTLLNYLPQYILSLDYSTQWKIFMEDEYIYPYSLSKYMMELEFINMGVIVDKIKPKDLQKQLQPHLVSDRINTKVHLAKDTNIVLYLMMGSKGNSGNIIAEISSYIHLITYLLQHNENIVILDTLHIFVSFICERMRIFDQDILDRIQIVQVDLDSFDSYYFKCPVIIHGWDQIKSINPEVDEKSFLDNIYATRIYLVESPKISSETSYTYKSNCLLPYYNNSVRQSNVSEIWYNLPLIPQKMNKPSSSSHRIIVKHDSNYLDQEMINIPILNYIASQFSQSRYDIDPMEYETSLLIEYNSPNHNSNFVHTKDLLRYWYDIEIEKIQKFEDQKLVNVTEIVHSEKITPVEYNEFIESNRKNKKRRINRRYITRNLSNPLEIYQEKSVEIPDTGIFLTTIGEGIHGLEEESIIILLSKMTECNIKETDQLIINNLAPIKRVFYNKHIAELSFTEFLDRSKWLDKLISAISIGNPHLSAMQLQSLWMQFSSWLLFSIGYEINPEYNVNIICNIADIYKQMKNAVRTLQSVDIKIRDQVLGFILEFEDESLFYIEEVPSCLGYFKTPIDIGQHYSLSSPIRIYNRTISEQMGYKFIPICLGKYDEKEYLFHYIDNSDWEIVGEINYYVNYSDAWGLNYCEISEGSIPAIPDVSPEISILEIFDRIIEKLDKFESIPVKGKVTMHMDVDSRYFVNIKLNDFNNQVVFDEEIDNYNELVSTLKKLLHKTFHHKGKNFFIKFINSMEWNELSRFGQKMIRHEKMEYDTIEELYETFMKFEGDKKIIFKIGYDSSACKSYCEFGTMTYKSIKKLYEEIKFKNTRYIRRVLKHGKCFTLDLLDNEYDLDDILDELGMEEAATYLSLDLLKLYNEKSVILNNIKLEFQWEFDDDHVIYQEDYHMLILYRLVTGSYFLKEVLPMSHTQEEKYQLLSLLFDPTVDYTVYNYSRSLRSGIIRQKPITTNQNECDAIDKLGNILNNIKESLPDHDFTELDDRDIVLITAECRKKYRDHMESCKKEYNHDSDDSRKNLTIKSFSTPEKLDSDKIKISINVDDDDILIEKIVDIQDFVGYFTKIIKEQYELVKDKDYLTENNFPVSPMTDYFIINENYIFEYDFIEIIGDLCLSVYNLDNSKSDLMEMQNVIQEKYSKMKEEE